MKRLVKWLLLPAVVVAGMIVVGADRAEAHRWVRRPLARVIVGPRYYYRQPPPYWHPRVHVYAPGVHVDVRAPRVIYGYGGAVVAPGVHVQW